MKRKTDYTILALAIPVFFVTICEIGCYNASVNQPVKHKRQLLEMGYTAIYSEKEPQRVKSYTIDAIYLDGKDTVRVKGLSQAQYDSLGIAE